MNYKKAAVFLFILAAAGIFWVIYYTDNYKKDEMDTVLKGDTFSGCFNSWKNNALLKSISIEKRNKSFQVTLHYRDSESVHTGVLRVNEIVVEAGEGLYLHLYLNGNELRMYKVKDAGYLPEDVELSFFRADDE